MHFITPRNLVSYWLILFLSANTIAAYGAIFTVSNSNDSGAGSLRQAILDANNSNQTNTIVFQIPGTGPFAIRPSSPLPSLGTPTAINATTQPGYSGSPLIEIDGSLAGANAIGLQFLSAFGSVRGVAINRFSSQGILFFGASNTIQGCYIGTDPTGKLARGNTSFGIWVQSLGNLIGGTNTGEGNLISGNDTAIYFTKGSNTVWGNLIGVGKDATNELRNTRNGLVIDNCGGNRIGGTNVAMRNIISGNGLSGIYLNNPLASGNVIQGNYIGVGGSGSVIISNAGDGITLYGAATNLIGGFVPGAANIISGNGLAGIGFNFAVCVSNVIAGNYIGTDATGKVAMGNRNAGLAISLASRNVIGGTNPGAGNLISGNVQDGIFLTDSAAQNVIQGNMIGLAAGGTNRLPNGFNGISISLSVSNLIGGNGSTARNVISGNANNGIGILQNSDTGNVISGNYIGTDVNGAKSMTNILAGIRIQGRANTIGGTVAGSGNVISGNGQQGIYIVGSGGTASGNFIAGNVIGLDATGASALANGDAGIGISGSANNQIGGTSASMRNILSANGGEGIFVMNAGSTNNIIQGNFIGTDITGFVARGNVFQGITFENTTGNQIGGSAAGSANLISANGNRGIHLFNASSNVVQGNLVGTKADGQSSLGNVFHGIDIDAGSTNNVVGGIVPGAGNVFAYAQSIYAGVRVRPNAFNNLVTGNSIFSNGALGIDLGNNGIDSNLDCQNGAVAGAANSAQNYPVLSAAFTGSGTLVRGTLNSIPGKTYRLEFFASPAGDSSGYGEGQLFLGQITLTLGASCSSNFSATLPVITPANWLITATATNPTNNTSEFSAWIPVTNIPSLKIVRGGATQISISWTNTGGFQLQHSLSLSPAVWSNISATPVLTSGNYLLTLTSTNPTDFYRLTPQ